MFTVHLEAAGFMKGKGAVGSPNRSLFNSVQASPIMSSNSLQGRKSKTFVQLKTPMPNAGNQTIVDNDVRSRSHTMVVPRQINFSQKEISPSQHTFTMVQKRPSSQSKLLTSSIKDTNEKRPRLN